MISEYEKTVTDRLIMQLQQGRAPWQQSFSPGCMKMPYNAKTGDIYKGVNSLWLLSQEYTDLRWLTYKQANEMDCKIKKGMQATNILYWKRSETVDQFCIFFGKVFNAEQIDGLPPLELHPLPSEKTRHARVEALLTASGAKIDIGNRNRSFYRGGDIDTIYLPEQHQFISMDNFYAAALHEMGHWTGHSSRLNRDIIYPFGSSGYAKEKLRASIASLMIGEQFSVGYDPAPHSSYVSSWIEII
ncbi:ArdC family protein [Bartonella rochalimae]|uniref:ArdC family protein n=1 Tax=Bartonella rochalimae TaxID=395923 RepID=UPI003F6832DB